MSNKCGKCKSYQTRKDTVTMGDCFYNPPTVHLLPTQMGGIQQNSIVPAVDQDRIACSKFGSSIVAVAN